MQSLERQTITLVPQILKELARTNKNLLEVLKILKAEKKK